MHYSPVAYPPIVIHGGPASLLTFTVSTSENYFIDLSYILCNSYRNTYIFGLLTHTHPDISSDNLCVCLSAMHYASIVLTLAVRLDYTWLNHLRMQRLVSIWALLRTKTVQFRRGYFDAYYPPAILTGVCRAERFSTSLAVR